MRSRLGRAYAACPAGTAAALTGCLILLLTAGRYGFHGDELYFRMLPLRWWYEDQPPLTVWLSRLARALSDDGWVQRVPAIVAAGAGALVAASYPRVLGYGRRVQEVAAWAQATTVYPLIVGHVFLTSSLDLLAWLIVIRLVVEASLGRRGALVWAGLAAGLACWNKLLVLPLVGALAVGLACVRRDLLRTREAGIGAGLLVLLGGPQVLAQAWHGWPMREVSGDLVAVHGGSTRLLVVPLLVAFVGPPLIGIALRGLAWRPPGRGRIGLLAPAAVVLVAWNLIAPAQPYYAVGLMLAALALGWGPASAAGSRVWARAPVVLAANALIAGVIALPLLPQGGRAYAVVAATNPVAAAQVGWPARVREVEQARGGRDVTVVTDAYALAGALDHFGARPVASGHNALWAMGPPHTDDVVLVGPRAVGLADRFARCEPGGSLGGTPADPFGVAGSPWRVCHGPEGGWPMLWPEFRHLGA